MYNRCLRVIPPTEKITFESAPSPQEFNEGDDADIVCDVQFTAPHHHLEAQGLQDPGRQRR